VSVAQGRVRSRACAVVRVRSCVCGRQTFNHEESVFVGVLRDLHAQPFGHQVPHVMGVECRVLGQHTTHDTHTHSTHDTHDTHDTHTHTAPTAHSTHTR
jgi:hypothetical protein